MSVHGKGLNRAGSGVGKLHTLASLTRIIAFGAWRRCARNRCAG
jgi:hypothetical protein